MKKIVPRMPYRRFGDGKNSNRDSKETRRDKVTASIGIPAYLDLRLKRNMKIAVPVPFHSKVNYHKHCHWGSTRSSNKSVGSDPFKADALNSLPIILTV